MKYAGKNENMSGFMWMELLAYGPLLLEYKTPGKRNRIGGFLATDAHKWLNVPYDCGLVFVKNQDALLGAVAASAAYLPEMETGSLPVCSGNVP